MKSITMLLGGIAILVSTRAIAAQPCGDVNDSGTVTSSDALAVLRKSVGQGVDLVCPAPGELLRTAQQTCWNGQGTEVPCVGTLEDGDVRAGIPLDYTDNGDGTVTDNVTGLMWEKLSRDGSIHDVNNIYTWVQGLDTKMDALDAASFAGHTDWRLPNIREVQSLYTYGGGSEVQVAGVFRSNCTMGCTPLECSCTGAAKAYWSSTTDPADPASAFAVAYSGGVSGTVEKADQISVRAVRNVN
jgi:hypothetical protein